VSTAARAAVIGSPLDGALLRRAKDRRGLTQLELARLAGVSRQLIARALHGERIAPASIRKIAEALAASPVVDGGLVAAPTQLEEG
jgi:transcriptional regulator with XRE-family HTH domain